MTVLLLYSRIFFLFSLVRIGFTLDLEIPLCERGIYMYTHVHQGELLEWAVREGCEDGRIHDSRELSGLGWGEVNEWIKQT